jgi:hypothetical protein
MKHLFFLCFFIGITVFVWGQQSPISFWNDVKEDSVTANPKGKLFIKYGSAKVFIANMSESPMSELWEPYKKREQHELAKIQSWWAGGGTVYTLKYISGKIIVYRQYIGEGDDDLPVERIKTIPLTLLTKNTRALDTEIRKYFSKGVKNW